MQPMQNDAPTADSPADDQAGADQGYTIELRVKGNGSMSISVEPDAEEAVEDGADPAAAENDGDAPADDSKPVSSLQEAFKVIKDIVSNAGQVADTSADQESMDAGYKEDL